MPSLLAAISLHWDSAELRVAVEGDPHSVSRGQVRLHLTQEAHLGLGGRAAKRQDLPAQGKQALAMRGTDGQDAPAVCQVRAVHDQRDFRPGPVGKQMPDDWPIPVLPVRGLRQHPPQTLDQVLALAGHGQRQGQGAQMAIGTDRQRLAEQRQVCPLRLGEVQPQESQLAHELPMQV